MATMKIFTLNLSGKTASLSLPTGLSVVQEGQRPVRGGQELAHGHAPS